jgi:hypothetical protein
MVLSDTSVHRATCAVDLVLFPRWAPTHVMEAHVMAVNGPPEPSTSWKITLIQAVAPAGSFKLWDRLAPPSALQFGDGPGSSKFTPAWGRDGSGRVGLVRALRGP